MTAPPKFGISFSFQVHRELGEPWDRSYREGIELAAEASRLASIRSGSASITARRMGTVLRPWLRVPPLPSPLPIAVSASDRARTPARSSAALGGGSLGAGQPVGRAGRDRPWAGLSARRVRDVRLAVCQADDRLRGVARYPRPSLARRALRLRGPRLQGEVGSAASPAGQAWPACHSGSGRRRPLRALAPSAIVRACWSLP